MEDHVPLEVVARSMELEEKVLLAWLSSYNEREKIYRFSLRMALQDLIHAIDMKVDKVMQYILPQRLLKLLRNENIDK